MHALFGAKPQSNGVARVLSPSPANQSPMSGTAGMFDRRQSMLQGQGGFQIPNGVPNSQPHPYQSSGVMPGQSTHFRPPALGGLSGQPRSPPLSHLGSGQYNAQVPPQVQQGFRPPPIGQANMMQSNGSQQGQHGRPSGSQSGMMMSQQRPGMVMGQQGMSTYGMHPGPSGPYSTMGYPHQGFYVSRT